MMQKRKGDWLPSLHLHGDYLRLSSCSGSNAFQYCLFGTDFWFGTWPLWWALIGPVTFLHRPCDVPQLTMWRVSSGPVIFFRPPHDVSQWTKWRISTGQVAYLSSPCDMFYLATRSVSIGGGGFSFGLVLCSKCQHDVSQLAIWHISVVHTTCFSWPYNVPQVIKWRVSFGYVTCFRSPYDMSWLAKWCVSFDHVTCFRVLQSVWDPTETGLIWPSDVSKLVWCVSHDVSQLAKWRILVGHMTCLRWPYDISVSHVTCLG